LGGLNVNVIIAGGIGQRVQQLSITNNIKVLAGAAAEFVENLATVYIEGTLVSGSNVCNH
jgi:predicted Fe-Mo cluster-binding NifX family protein